jgi:Golgi phosphoprotein 3
MSSASGLTRRRGGGGGAGAAGDNENSDSSRVASPVNKAGGSRDTSGPETSYESGENGHRIAFDPRDISESAERSKQPKLTLMEEVLLLGLKDKQVRCCSVGRDLPCHICPLACLGGCCFRYSDVR